MEDVWTGLDVMDLVIQIALFATNLRHLISFIIENAYKTGLERSVRSMWEYAFLHVSIVLVHTLECVSNALHTLQGSL